MYLHKKSPRVENYLIHLGKQSLSNYFKITWSIHAYSELETADADKVKQVELF